MNSGTFRKPHEGSELSPYVGLASNAVLSNSPEFVHPKTGATIPHIVAHLAEQIEVRDNLLAERCMRLEKRCCELETRAYETDRQIASLRRDARRADPSAVPDKSRPLPVAGLRLEAGETIYVAADGKIYPCGKGPGVPVE